MRMKQTDKDKIAFADALAELILMGFDLKKNTAEDLIEAVFTLVELKAAKKKEEYS